MSELPKGWIELTLADVVKDITGGGTPSKSQKEYFKGTIPFMTVKDMKVNRPDDTIDKITQSAIDNSSANLIDANTLIISTRMGLGKIVKVDFACAINQDLKALYLEDVINIDYFEYQYRSLTSLLESLGKGTTVKGIRLEVLKSIKILVAPLNEQIRIANKLDSILAKVDKAQVRLDKIPAILKRFRQSVLAAATSGELTKEWREGMGFTKDTWLPTSLDSLSVKAFDGPFGSKLKTADYTDCGIKVARLENIGHLVFNSDKQTFISETKYQELVKNTLEHNDVLFSSFVDEEIRTCLFDERFGTHINKADCFCIRANQEMVSPEFLMYSLACKHTYEKIKKQVHGATRPRVNLRFLKSFEIALPSPKEQAIVVDKINQLFSKANKVEKQYLEAKARLDRLTQSILAKAFRGELVPQDPNDEPAEKLLERIVAEKELSKPKKITRKRATKAKTAEKE